MGRAIDALIAFRLVRLLVTPFNKTQAFKLGIIDEKGKVFLSLEILINYHFHKEQRQEKHIQCLFVLFLISKDY